MNKKYGLLFPGQGSQFVGMGQDLYNNSFAAKYIFDKSNEKLDIDILKLCFNGPEEELKTTSNSQVAIFVTSIATLNVLLEKIKKQPIGEEGKDIFSQTDVNLIGSLTMGLSLGEITSLVACGVLSFEDGLTLVYNRGKFMEEASKEQEGKMASIIGLELEKVEELCVGIGGCQVANLNCPGQIVISGNAKKIELVSDLAKSSGAKRVIMLKVSGAFHSYLMRSAKEKLKNILETIEFKNPTIDFISNIDAIITTDPIKIKDNLIKQLDSRTLWEASVKEAEKMGITNFLEIGPGTVLKGLLKKINKSFNVTSLQTMQDIDDFCNNLG